jgi:hypothetical protein
MSARIVVEQTADGWNVTVTNGENVVVRTAGARVTVAVVPDDDDTTTQPLDVTLQP